MAKKKKEQIILGSPLIPNAGVRSWYSKELNDLVAKMDERTRREVLNIFKKVSQKGGSIESQERILLNKLEQYYTDLFGVKFRVLLDPSLKCGQPVRLESAQIPAANGVYYIYSLTHRGELRAEPFYTELSCRNYDAKN